MRLDSLKGVFVGAAAPLSTVTTHGAISSEQFRPEPPSRRDLDGKALSDAILSYAMLAPSSHNTQPWRCHIESDRHWIVGPDISRQLCAVDPEARELVLSVGTFVEYLCIAARAFGLAAEADLLGVSRTSPEMVAIALAPCAPTGTDDLERIRNRRTIRIGYRSDPLRDADIDALRSALGDGCAWFPRGSSEASWLAAGEQDAFTQQAWRDDAQQELATWFRFSEADVLAHRDGLTLAAMEVGGIECFFAEHFMHAKSVMGKSFREHGIASTATQVATCAGWLLITTDGDSVPQLLDAGRRYARMALLLRERGLAAAPMSQMMEESPWQQQLGNQLELPGVPQFVLRVGYVDDYPPPVSPRRAPASILE